MDEAPIKLENILEQASKWTFAGDFTLLQWMKQISQDLENRGNRTTEALAKLDNNVKATNISLANVANSLTTLQFGNQFVECRVQDDDDIHVKNNEASKDIQKDPELTTTSKEMLNIFLENNLKVLRNCHEKYSIDLEDSDDEEISNGKTCIYQPINPYNERPLPFIFGSKEWHSKWHVGLYENQQENTYSGDEISEEFSESSSASHLGDNESFESYTEWASSNSMDNDHLNANIEIKNASSLRGSQSLYPENHTLTNATKIKATKDESSSISTTSSSFAKKPLMSINQNEHLTQRSESINSISSKSSSKVTAKAPTVNKENTSQYKPQPQKFVDLFEEPPEDIEYYESSSPSSTLNKMGAADDIQSLSFQRTSALRTQPTPFVDLFAEPPEEIKTSVVSSSQNVKRKTVNLFEEDKNDNTEVEKEFEKSKNDTLNQERINVTNKPSTVSNISKSLFDDSDDDDDFLKAFIKRSSDREAPKSTLSKTLFFDNEIHEPTSNSNLLKTDGDKESGIKTISNENHFNNKIRNIFDDNDKIDEDLSFPEIKKVENKLQMPSPVNEIETSNSVTKLQAKSAGEENIRKPVNLLQEFNSVPKINNTNEDKISKSKNLFDDLEEDDDLFSTKSKNQSDESFQQTSIKDERKENSSKRNEENSFDNSKEVHKVFKNQLMTNYSKDNSSGNKEYKNKSKQIIAEDHTIEQTITSEIVENKLDKVQLFEASNLENYTQYQKDENNHNSTTIMQNTSALVSENITKPSSSNNYEFNSVLFLDEPPEDDNEFFETLAKAPNTLNSNYNSIDLENDVYEPELPKVPVASSSNNQGDTPDNFYTGLQLFSDIPPDDDDAGRRSKIYTPSLGANQTNRLHSVFYDDFNETLVALNQKHAEEEISKHSVFSNEPPPMNEEELKSTSRDIVDHSKVPDSNQDITYVEHKTESLSIDAQLEEPVNENTNLLPNKRQISKLQMPDININIKALLPAANITIRKAKENSTKENVFNFEQDDSHRTLDVSKETVNEKTILIAEIPKTGETKHILPNLTKNRVKASSARRPSTRKARQESYRKSLFEQQQILGADDKNIIIQNENTQTHIIQAPSRQVVAHEQYPKETINVKESFDERSKNNEANVKPEQKRNFLFFADEEEDDDFFKHITTSEPHTAIKSKEKEKLETAKPSVESGENNASSSLPLLAHNMKTVTKEIPVLPSTDAEFRTAHVPSVNTIEEYKKQEPIKEIENLFNFDANSGATANVKNTKKITNDSKSFLTEEDDDDDLFKSSLQQHTKSNKNKDQLKKAKSQFKSFLDSESEEEFAASRLQKGISTQSIKVPSEKISNINIPIHENINPKLFPNSESESDDLFENLCSSKTSNNKSSSEFISNTQIEGQPQPSLFGDESDSDDFLTHSSSFSKNPVPKKTIKKNQPKATTQTNASLFSDLDSDEDDLFGGKSAKIKTSNDTNIPNVKVSTISKTTAAVADISKSESVYDNPLADLL